MNWSISEYNKNNEDIRFDLIGEPLNFPKYTTQIMNLANQNSQATRPKIVGQLSDLIQEFDGKSYTEWIVWYANKYPNAIEDATEKITIMIELLKEAILLIDKEMVRTWVKDLIITKTFSVLKFLESILKKLAELNNVNYRLAKPDEESIGIDGFIGKQAVSIKPITYKTKNMLNEQIEVPIIFYEKRKMALQLILALYQIANFN